MLLSELLLKLHLRLHQSGDGLVFLEDEVGSINEPGEIVTEFDYDEGTYYTIKVNLDVIY